MPIYAVIIPCPDSKTAKEIGDKHYSSTAVVFIDADNAQQAIDKANKQAKPHQPTGAIKQS